ncbi:adenylyl cyclase 78C-like, partial [Sitodiplosis mosellana]|uniref:adenylyl cyclase 78C-like n=1 Tax=Sitodiplosis mosellana TaxID=263140 RepID=UPI002443C4AD
MTTYWVFGKGVSVNQIVPQGPLQAGVPQATSPSLQRQVSHHTSLAAVVYGMMQASKRSSNVNTTRWRRAKRLTFTSMLAYVITIESQSSYPLTLNHVSL